MKSEWRVTSNVVGGRKVYGVYRLLDADGVDHSGNREMYGDYLDARETAASIAESLNGLTYLPGGTPDWKGMQRESK
jgi:hypothetical protein